MTSPKTCPAIVTSSSSSSNTASANLVAANNFQQGVPSALTVSHRILRSPSHESFSTDLSLISISVSSMASEATSVLNRSSCSLLTKTMEDKLGNLLIKDAKKNRFVELKLV